MLGFQGLIFASKLARVFHDSNPRNGFARPGAKRSRFTEGKTRPLAATAVLRQDEISRLPLSFSATGLNE